MTPEERRQVERSIEIERRFALTARPQPGQMALVMAGLTVGFLLMSLQLWMLTVSLELYLGGQTGRLWQLALASGVIFLGGLVVVWLLRRRPGYGGLAAEDELAGVGR